MVKRELLIGIAEASVMHAVPDEFDLDTRFHMVKEAGIFDYYDKTPATHEIQLYRDAVQKHALPIAAGSL